MTTAAATVATRSNDLRQRAAIVRSRDRRRAELAPSRQQVADAIEAVGWRKARPIIVDVLGTAVRRVHRACPVQMP